MNAAPAPRSHWRPVLASRDLRRKPKRVLLEDRALVLFRGRNGVSCLSDMCPHRYAPLSNGRVVDDTIECPYHGWRFDCSGTCVDIPLHDGPLPRRFVPALAARESHGLIFVTEDPDTAAPIHGPTWDDQGFVRTIMQSEAECTLEEVVENTLDPIHTLFVHRGLLRGARRRRSRLDISVAVTDGVLKASFAGEEGQDGLLSRLLEGERCRSLATFRMPGVVELLYWGPSKLNLVTTLYFTRTEGTRHKGFAVMTGPNRFGEGYLKALIFIAIMRLVIRQDCDLMTSAIRNRDRFGCPPPARSPLDLFGPAIDAVVHGRPLPEGAPTRLSLEI